jgi:hypothetical protein
MEKSRWVSVVRMGVPLSVNVTRPLAADYSDDCFTAGTPRERLAPALEAMNPLFADDVRARLAASRRA